VADVDLTAAVISVFAVKVIRDDAEFSYGIEIGNNGSTIVFSLP